MNPSRRTFLRLTTMGAVTALPVFTSCSRLVPRAMHRATREFLDAARSGDLDRVRRLLATDSSLLQAADGLGRSAFVLAHLNSHREVGAFLVEQGYRCDAHEAALAQDWERFAALTDSDETDVDRDHPIGGSAMFAAALGGAGSNIWRVYAATGDPNAMPRGPRGVSPLQAALNYRDLATAELTAASLLSNHADPNPRSLLQDSPLHLAARRGSFELAEMLVRHGADTASRNRDGRIPVELAEQAGHDDVANLLRRHRDIPRTHSTSRTAYDVDGRSYEPPDISDIPLADRGRFVGQSHGNLDSVTEALADDPRMAHSIATTGEICVEACAHTGRKALVELLLEHGAPYSLPTAVMRNDVSRVRQLLAQDPLRIYERGAHDFALLWYPIIGRCGSDMMELLLDRGADVEQQHFLGTTALHWACTRGPVEIVELLIDRGADVNRRGRKFGATGETPLQRATKYEQPEIARLLRQRGATA